MSSFSPVVPAKAETQYCRDCGYWIPAFAGTTGFVGLRRSQALGRDDNDVHADVQVLTAAGLLDATDGGVRADYDAIETKIAI